MPVTVGANSLSVVHKSSNGLTIAFPDVCKTPVPVGGVVPIPYPNIATTAMAAQKAQQKSTTKGSGSSKSTGDAAGTVGGGVSSNRLRGAVKVNPKTAVEIQQIKGMLSHLNIKLQALKSNDPNEWQAVLQEYAVAASALYMTQNNG